MASVEKLPCFQRVVRFVYAIIIAGVFYTYYDENRLDNYRHLNFIILGITVFTFLIGSVAAVDDYDAHYVAPPRTSAEESDNDSIFNFSMTLDELEPIYGCFLAWKWYIILYQICFLTLVSTTSIMLYYKLFVPELSSLWPNFKESDEQLHYIPLFTMIVDIMFNCVPMIHRHYIFTFVILSVYAVYVVLVEPTLYNIPHYPFLVLGVSFIV